MLDSKGFDLWANGYDKSVGLSDQEGSYPFAGYRNILNAIYGLVLSGCGKTVLDIGFGTGNLTVKLYQQGCTIYGQDFSPRMIELAQQKMPEAKLYEGDFSLGLVRELTSRKYDAIIATYALHHLTDAQKAGFIGSLLPLLNENGRIYIGDVAFETRADLNACRALVGEDWDQDEIYFVYDELKPLIPNLTFQKYSDCAGLFIIKN